MPVKILLADKSITIQKVVEMLFSGREYEVMCVSDGETALREAARMNPDVVLADVDLPRVDGYTFGARLKQTPEGALIPVILMMSRDDVYDSVKGKQSSIVDNIAKPFESQELIGKVKKAISAAPPRLTEPDSKPAPAAPAPQAAAPAARPAAPVLPPKPKPQPTPSDIFDIIQEAPAAGAPAKAAALPHEADVEEAVYEVEPEVEEIGEPLMKEATKALPIGPKAVEEMRAGFGLADEGEEISAEIVPFESFALAMETEMKPKAATPPAPPPQPEARPALMSSSAEQVFAPAQPEAELRAMAEAAMAKAAKEAISQIPPPSPPTIPMHELRQMAEEIMAKTAKELMREAAPPPALSASDIWGIAEETIAKMAKDVFDQMPVPAQTAADRAPLPEKELRSIAEETISKMALDIFKDMAPPIPNVSEETIRRGLQDAVMVVAREMAKEIIEQVAWEVIPQMAELLITEEIERLKALQ